MAQNARKPGKLAFVWMVLALTLPAVAAQAGENREHRTPLVLNGRLNTSDFTGGVGYAAYGGSYITTSVYVSGASSSSYAATTAFVAAARAQAFAAAGSGHR
jgi:drug/metabolite transporter superfamily protein YnfA